MSLKKYIPLALVALATGCGYQDKPAQPEKAAEYRAEPAKPSEYKPGSERPDSISNTDFWKENGPRIERAFQELDEQVEKHFGKSLGKEPAK